MNAKTVLMGTVATLCAMMPNKAIAQEEPQSYRNVSITQDTEGKDVYGDFISSPNGIKEAWLSPNAPYVFFTDKSGMMYIYNTETLEKKTATKNKNRVRFANDNGYALSKRPGFFKNPMETEFYNYDNELTWTCEYPMACLNLNGNIAICYDYKKSWGYSTILMTKELPKGKMIAYDTKSGKELWRKDIPHKYHFPWGDCYSLDSYDKNKLYVMADSLYLLDTRDGTAKVVPFEAGVEEPKLLALHSQRTLSNPIWQTEKYYSYPPFTSQNFKTGTHSNIIWDGDNMYVADARNIYCLTKDLATVWETPIPDDMGSYSEICKNGDTITMQNYGIAFQGGGITKCGMPFSAAFDAKTGKQLYLNVHNEKMKLISGLLVQGCAYWQDTKAIYYNNDGEKELKVLNWKLPQIKITKKLPNDPYKVIVPKIFIEKDNHIDSICTDKEQIIFQNYDKKIYIANKNGEYTCREPKDCFVRMVKGFYKNVDNDNRVYIITKGQEKKIEHKIDTINQLTDDYNGNIIIKTKEGIGIIRI